MKTGITVIALAAACGIAGASIVQVEGGSKIEAPQANAAHRGTAEADYVMGFDEAQNIVLTEGLTVELSDGSLTTLAAGTTISSHMVYFDPIGSPSPALFAEGVDVEFDAQVLGVITDSLALFNTHGLLGHSDLSYPEFHAGYGFTGELDSATFSGSTVNFTSLSSGGDYIRVITVGTVPAPGAMALLGLGGLVAGRRRR